MKPKRAPYMPPSKSQTHLSPKRIFEMIEEKWGLTREQMYDPFPPYNCYKAPCFFNAFYGPWQPFNYVNSPFEKETLEKAVHKAHEEAQEGRVTILLAPVKTDQDWYHDIILKHYYNDILWIRRRLHFANDKDSAMGAHFLVRIA